MNIWSFLDLFSTICCIIVAVLVYSRNPKEADNRSFCQMAFFLGLWAFIQFGFCQSRSLEEAVMWRPLIGAWPVIETVALAFTLHFTERGRFLKTVWFKGVVVIPAVVFAILESTTGLVFDAPKKLAVGWIAWIAPYSPLRNTAMTWFTANIFLMIFLVAHHIRTTPDAQKRSHARSYFFALFIVGVIDTFDQVTLIYSLGIPYLNPVGFAVAMAFVGYGIHKYKLFSLTPTTAAESIISTMDDMLLLVDIRGKIVTVNRAVYDTLGYSESELIGQDVRTLFVTPLTWLDDICRSDKIPSNRVTDIEVSFIKEDRLIIPVSLSGTAIRDQGDKIQGAILIGRDITARKQAEKEKADLMAMYQQSQKLESIGRLAGGVAHDMNNILGAIMASSLVLKDEVAPTSDASESIDNALSACYRGRDLTQNLLGFARKGKYIKSDISINHAVMETVAILNRTVSKNVRVTANLEDNLTAFEGDRGQIQSVLMNICINAVDAIAATGQVALETSRTWLDENRCVKLGGITPGNYIQLKVIDNGIGMDADTLKNAFEPFFTTKPIGRGTGLGLAMAYGVVINHGGAITIESEVGKGTTVTVYFPSTDKPTPRLSDTVDDENSIGHHNNRDEIDKMGILLVDDEPLFQSSAKRLLNKMGHEVFVADSGYKALEMYDKNRAKISVVLLDMLMPGMDGTAVFHQLKKMNPQVKILIISGFDKDENVDKLISHGANGYLQKPFNRQALSKELETVFRT
jgi:PAS domain S-box-containing protein